MVFSVKSHRWLLLVLLCALVLRIGLGLTRQGLDASTDELHWDRIAGAFLEEGMLSKRAGTYRPPLYSLLLAGTYGLCGQRPEVVRLWQALLGTVTCGLLYAFGRRLSGEWVGMLAAGMAAVYPLFVFFTGVLMAETLLDCLAAAVLVQGLRLEEAPALGRGLGLGVLLGLAGLTKPVLLAWAPLLLWGWWRRARLGRKGKGARLAAVVGGMILVTAPWSGRNYLATGHLVPVSTNMGINLLIGHEPEATGVYREGVDYLGMYDRLVQPETDPVVRDRLAVRRVGARIAADPLRALQLAGRKLFLFWSPLVTGEDGWRGWIGLLSSGPLLALGLWGCWQLRGSAGGWMVGSLLVSLSLVHALFFAHTRFRLPIDTALIGPAALALVEHWKKRTE